jgi:hypothetical protein
MPENTMQWVAIDENNLPENEVLAANFMPDTYGYREKIVGFICYDEDEGICASNEHEMLFSVTHYIDISKFDLNQ